MLFTLPPIRTLILADLPVKLKGSADFFELKILFLGILDQFLASW